MRACMRPWRFVILLSLLYAAVADDPVPEERTGLELRILEIRKVDPAVTSGDRPSTSNHPTNVKIILANHAHIAGVKQWKLFLNMGGTGESAALEVEENIASEQKELVFDVVLKPGLQTIAITAWNQFNGQLAAAITTLMVPELDAEVAWVGRPYSSSSAFLRVDPGSFSQVQVGSQVCRAVEAPCYYLEEELPEEVARCVGLRDSITHKSVVLCDDTVQPFVEFNQPPTLDMTDKFDMTVGLSLPQDTIVASTEVLAFNPQDPTIMYSPAPYTCRYTSSSKPGVRTCTQHLSLTEPRVMAVLVVAVLDEGLGVQSSLVSYGGDPPVQVRTGMIVGAVVGSLVGLLIIIAIVVIIVRGKKARRTKENKRTSEDGYTAAPSSDPTRL